jgi:hypothetical protein
MINVHQNTVLAKLKEMLVSRGQGAIFRGILALTLVLPLSVYAEIEEGKSGIQAIDTLAVYDWDRPTENKSLPTALLLSVFPGGMQYYFNHPVRGAFITAIEGGLAYEVLVNKPLQRDKRISQAEEIQDSISYYTEQMNNAILPDSVAYWASQRISRLNRLRSINDQKRVEESLRRSEEAWLLGMHVYSVMDGIGIWKHNQGRVQAKKETFSAMWRAALLPGWGQLYNDEWGKAGLLYMAYIGSYVSYHERQSMVEYFLDRKHTASAEGLSDEVADMEEQITFFRKKRNQYIWGPALFYLYSIADAAVDAMLSDFENPLHLSWYGSEEWQLSVAWNF